MLALEREDFFQALKFPREENAGFLLPSLSFIIFKMCGNGTLGEIGWQYSADFEESLPSHTQYDQADFGRNCANKLSWSEMLEFVMIQNIAPNI